MTLAHKKKTWGLVITALATVLFGIHPSATRAVYADGGNAAFVMIASTTARMFGLLLMAMILKKRLFKTKADVRMAMKGGAAQAISAFSITLALTSMPGPVAVVILHSAALILLLFSVWRGEEKLQLSTLLATFSALFGLTLAVNAWHMDRALSITGISFAFLSAFATAARRYIYGHQTQHRSPIAVGAESFVFTLLLSLPLVFFATPHFPVTTKGYLWLALGCTVSTVGTIGMFYGISLLGAFEYSLFSKMEPIFTSLFAIVLISEVLQPIQYAGMVIVVGSLMAYQYHNHWRQKIVSAKI